MQLIKLFKIIIGDLERMVTKVSTSRISPRELVQLKNSIKVVDEIKLISQKIKLNDSFNSFIDDLEEGKDIISLIESQINEEAPVSLNNIQ